MVQVAPIRRVPVPDLVRARLGLPRLRLTAPQVGKILLVTRRSCPVPRFDWYVLVVKLIAISGAIVPVCPPLALVRSLQILR